jgi:predicted nucleotidyltransferase
VVNGKYLNPSDEPSAKPAAWVQTLRDEPELEFAVLVGSRATGTAHADSDWDIALQWSHQLDWLTVLGKTETLRRALAQHLNVAPTAIDLIELRRANLAMRASVAEEGLPLAGEDSLAWTRFLQRTWRELEDYYWDKQHAA